MDVEKLNLRGSLNCTHRNKCSVIPPFFEFNNTIGKCKQSKIFSNANIFTGMINSATLTKNNVTRNNWLTTENFYTKALALRVASILYTAFTFFMCHDYLFKIFPKGFLRNKNQEP